MGEALDRLDVNNLDDGGIWNIFKVVKAKWHVPLMKALVDDGSSEHKAEGLPTELRLREEPSWRSDHFNPEAWAQE